MNWILSTEDKLQHLDYMKSLIESLEEIGETADAQEEIEHRNTFLLSSNEKAMKRMIIDKQFELIESFGSWQNAEKRLNDKNLKFAQKVLKGAEEE